MNANPGLKIEGAGADDETGAMVKKLNDMLTHTMPPVEIEKCDRALRKRAADDILERIQARRADPYSSLILAADVVRALNDYIQQGEIFTDA